MECGILRLYFLGQVVHAKGHGAFFLPYPVITRRLTSVQTKTQEITNNLIAGTVGGFVGTALNTPCQSCYCLDEGIV